MPAGVGTAGIALTALGILTGGAGAFLKAGAAGKARDELRSAQEKWLPDTEGDISKYFDDLVKYGSAAAAMNRQVGTSDLETKLALRERAEPGAMGRTQAWGGAIDKLIKGDWNDLVHAGGWANAGSGFGGSGAGNVAQFNTSRRARLQELGMIPSLLASLRGFETDSSAPGAGAFLSQITNPAQRTQTQLNVRSQNLGVAGAVAGMPSGNAVYGQWLSSLGGAAAGAGSQMMLGGGAFANPGVGAMPRGAGYWTPQDDPFITPKLG